MVSVTQSPACRPRTDALRRRGNRDRSAGAKALCANGVGRRLGSVRGAIQVNGEAQAQASRTGTHAAARLLLLAIVALGATGLGIVAYETDLLRSLELSTVNTRFSIRGRQRPPANIVLVEVDPTPSTNWACSRLRAGFTPG